MTHFSLLTSNDFQIKELESQLLVERKLARQHVDSKIAEMKQEREELNCDPVRPPLTTKLIGVNNTQLKSKDQSNLTHLSDEFTFCPVPMGTYVRKNDSLDKENNQMIAEQLRLPKQTGRLSVGPVQKIPTTPAQRRHSLIPQPSLPANKSFLPLTPIQAEDGGVEMSCLPEQIPCDSPKDHRNRGKKMSSALRRSLRKMNVKSPMQAPIRRVGVNVGMEKLRVSIGGRGRTGQRVLLGNARRAVKDTQQKKQSHREKERGWNIGTTAARTLL